MGDLCRSNISAPANVRWQPAQWQRAGPVHRALHRQVIVPDMIARLGAEEQKIPGYRLPELGPGDTPGISPIFKTRQSR